LNYLKKPYSVTMGTFQMSILLGFNNSTTLGIKELQEFSQLPEKELIKQVQSLVESKIVILQDTNNPVNKDGDNANSDLANKQSIVMI
jgi:cullin 2